jgi:pyrroloquinoline quinone (PQQ) biosynthesis protein C
MNLQTFWEEIQGRIARHDLLCHPFYKAWAAGELSATDLREYAADYYHHVAAFYAYESQVPRVAKEKAKGLRERYGADRKTCAYFDLHTMADIYHAQVWRDELENLVAQHPEQAPAALRATEECAQALWQALDGIERGRLARKQAA